MMSQSQPTKFLALLCLVFLLILVTFSNLAKGQDIKKRDLKPSDYQQWGELHFDKVSQNELWASFMSIHENTQDTLFVKNIVNNKTYVFPSGNNSIFSRKDYFVCQVENDIRILNLTTGKQEVIFEVKNFVYASETDHLIILLEEKNENNLIIIDLTSNTRKEISDVIDYQLSPQGSKFAYTSFLNYGKAVSLIDLKNVSKIHVIFSDDANDFIGLTWQKDGKSLAFIERNRNQAIVSLKYYIIENKKLFELDPDKQSDFPDNFKIIYQQFNRILISDDLKKIFFSIQNEEGFSKIIQQPSIEIWNANDKFTLMQNNAYGNYKLKSKVMVWLPQLQKVSQLTTTMLPELILTGDFEHAILSNPQAYEPQFEQNGPRDFYIANINTGEKKIVLQNHPYHPYLLYSSPAGKYFVYFKDNNWWTYNISTNVHTNITINIKNKFVGKTEVLVPESAYGSPGWTLNDKEIIIYDQYDLWVVTPDGKVFRRLTKGREVGIKYRIAPEPNKTGRNRIFNGTIQNAIDLSKGLFLFAKGDDEKTGYYRWNARTGEQSITYNNSYVDELNYNGTKKKIFYREQKFDVSPQLMLGDNFNSPSPLFKSNLQQDNYFWGKSELITYLNSKGTKLNGALFYPANYDPSKKYPMIVHVYERQSQKLHVYQNPRYEGGNINVTIFTTQGYFVFLPDIQLLERNPGISAADCVIAATKKIIEKGIVDPSRIGLMGHSFGGYETAFIITQTNLFAAALASGGITDLVSFYHTINTSSGVPDMWRFKKQQWNMGGTPYELPELYQANSPIAHVQNVQTPVLLWTGKNDPQVDPHQTMEFYLALRRLGKQGIMLLYPEEGHILMSPENEKDLTYRTIEWFDYYLKDDKSAEWITQGTAPIKMN